MTEGGVVPGTSLSGVLRDVARHPARLLLRWNWKSAVASSLIRSTIFFTANLPSGRGAAWAAFTTEICLRLATSGFWGGLTQELGRAEPPWKAMVGAMIALPVLSHGLEFVVHALRGTPELAAGIVASSAFTVLSTSFNVFAMRRGALITGPGSQPLHHDLARIPSLMASFVSIPVIATWRALSRLAR